jgi:GMP synthase (glutamine-hydrolysing)
MMNRDELKILLLQIRQEPIVRQEELESFATYSQLDIKQIDVLNVFETPIFKPEVVQDYDAVFVGGSSDANVLQPDIFTFVDNSIALLQYCSDNSIPTFASCFGFQLAILAFNGVIQHKSSDYELGIMPISLTESAHNDPVFKGVPNDFLAISVHKQYADTLPDSMELLAYTDQCVHSFRLKDKPFWAFQFHPEVDKAAIIKRLTIYKDQYTKDYSHLEKILNETVDMPESNSLLKNFVDRVLLGGSE